MSWANKFRPKRLDDIVGQRITVSRLKSTLDKVNSDTFLLTGTKGTGKTSTARIIAKYLNCTNKQEIEPCNKCISCKSIESDMNPNVIEIDAASNRGINEAREIRQILQYTPPKNSYRIIILDEAHQLTKEAFNALLKSLEEMPDRNVIILCTTNPSAIPETVLSRCKTFNYIPMRHATIAEHLVKICKEMSVTENGEEPTPKNELSVIAKLSEGSMRNAIQLLEEVATVCKDDIKQGSTFLLANKSEITLLNEAVFVALEGDNERTLLFVEKMSKSGIDLRTFINDLLKHTRDLIVVKELSKPEIIIQDPTLLEGARVLLGSRTIHSHTLQGMLNNISHKMELLAYNVPPRIILELILLEG